MDKRIVTKCLILVFLGVLHQVMQYILKIPIAKIDDYLDPLLFFPILFSALVLERQCLMKNSDYRLSVHQIIIYFISITVLVEVLYPYWNSRFVFDFVDILLYALGTIIFMVFINRNK